MKLIIKTHSANEHFNGDCDYALVDLDSGLAARLLRFRDAFNSLLATERDLQDIRFYDSVDWLNAEWLDGDTGKLEDEVYSEGYAVAPADFAVAEEHMQRTECDRVNVDRTGVRWECYPKHCDPLIETQEIPWAVIEEASRQVDSTRRNLIWDGKFVAGGTFERGE